MPFSQSIKLLAIGRLVETIALQFRVSGEDRHRTMAIATLIDERAGGGFVEVGMGEEAL